jgi:thymidylate synthase ThyX
MNQPTYFKFEISNPLETELTLISLTDTRTGFIVRTALPKNGQLTASIMAFAGARFSRSALSATDLFKEIKMANKDANERLSSIFRAYGHASVADMAQLFSYIEGVPQWIAMSIFEKSSVGGGQERSTRYQNFNTLQTVGDNLELQDLSLNFYSKWIDKLTQKYIEIYEIDINDKFQKSSLTARVFDTARAFLPFGAYNTTSLAYITSAREWARIISICKSSQYTKLQNLGEQLEFLFAPNPEIAEHLGYTPEAPDLIRYTEAEEVTKSSLENLRIFLDKHNFDYKTSSNKIINRAENLSEIIDGSIPKIYISIALNILSLNTCLDFSKIIAFLVGLDKASCANLSKILLFDFNHHNQMNNSYNISEFTYNLSITIAESRDFNRHRAWSRYSPIINTQSFVTKDLINFEYILPLYLTENSLLKSELQEFEKDLQTYYQVLQKADLRDEMFIEFLPFAQKISQFMSGSLKDVSYMTKLRVRPGGHINYRDLAYQMAQQASKTNALLSAIGLSDDLKPDPCSRVEFVDRG